MAASRSGVAGGHREQLARAEARAESLRGPAPFAGEVRDIPPALRVGDDIRRLELLGMLFAVRGSLVQAYVAEPDLDRVVLGAVAEFMHVDGSAIRLVVSEVARASTRSLDVPELASVHEGPIPVRRMASGALTPERAIYRIVLTGPAPLGATTTRTVGRVVIQAPARSLADIIYRRTVALVLRESSL